MTHRQLSLHAPSLGALPPSALVEAAASAGFDAVGLRLLAPPGAPATIDLTIDASERRRVIQGLRSNGTFVLDVEVFALGSGRSHWEPQLDVAAEFGASHVLAVGFDADQSRLSASLRELEDAAAERSLRVVLEPITYSTIDDLAAALELVEPTSAGIVVDALQFFRSGTPVEALSEVPASRLPYVQICDGPLRGPGSAAARRQEARTRRLAPGTGEFPLTALLAAMPPGIPVSVEVPDGNDRSDPVERASRLVAAARAVTENPKGHFDRE